MDCQAAREGLWPPELPRLVGEDVAAARAHVESCPECRAYFDQDRALLEVYDRTRLRSAPVEVRERVFDALAQVRRDSTGTREASAHARRGGSMVAAIALLAAAYAVFAGNRASEAPPEPSVAGTFAEDYLRRAVAEDHIVTTDAAAVRRFLQRELGMPLEPLERAGLALERAEICLIRGQRGALIVYKLDGATISHYLIPRDDARPQEPTVAEYRDGPGDARMPVVTWSTPRIEQALIGEVDADELLRMAAGAT